MKIKLDAGMCIWLHVAYEDCVYLEIWYMSDPDEEHCLSFNLSYDNSLIVRSNTSKGEEFDLFKVLGIPMIRENLIFLSEIDELVDERFILVKPATIIVDECGFGENLITDDDFEDEDHIKELIDEYGFKISLN